LLLGFPLSFFQKNSIIIRMHQTPIINQILRSLGRAEGPRVKMPLQVAILPDFIVTKEINWLWFVEDFD
jgi:hypothetical protein